jgi:hypothetical protein
MFQPYEGGVTLSGPARGVIAGGHAGGMRLPDRLQPALRQIAVGHAATRVVVGVGMLVAPAVVRGWLGRGTDSGGGRVALQALGVREAALGLGILHQLRHGQPVRHWFQLGLAFELTDALATLRNRSELPESRVPDAIALFALSGLVGGAAVGFGLDE